MDLRSIDRMPSGVEKLKLWIEYAKKYDCLHDMTEIHDLYSRLKKKGVLNTEDWNRMINN